MITIAVATLVFGGLALADVGGRIVGTICACMLIFVLPGAAVAIANPIRARFGERNAIGVALGIAGLILGTVALAATGLELDSTLWTLILICFSLLTCNAMFLLFPEAAPESHAAATQQEARRASRRTPTFRDILVGTAAVAFIAAAVVVTVSSHHDQVRRDEFTQLWMLPEPDRPDIAIVGLRNHEDVSRQYRLVAAKDGSDIRTWDPITLAPGHAWVGRVRAPAVGGRVRVTAVNDDQGPRVTRSASITLR